MTKLFPFRRLSTLLLALFLFVATAFAERKQVHIMGINDMHAAIEYFPKLVSIADSLRALYPDLIVVSAGDNRTGNPISDEYSQPSLPMVELMNKAGFHFTTLGNHEFDGQGVQGLRNVINNSNFRYLCANIIAPDSMRLRIDPFAIVEQNGLRIGIVGVVQVGANGFPDCHPNFVRGLRFAPVTETVRRYASWMRGVCDVLVVLSHIGLDDDLKLAADVPEVDVIVGGHSHTKVDPCEMVGNVMVTQTERWLKYCTHITLDVEDGRVVDKRAELIDVRAHATEDAATAAMVRQYSDNPRLQRVLAQAVTPFETKEELGNLMADAMREGADADIAVQNNGGVRYETKPAGPFTVGDVYSLAPFCNDVYIFRLSGEELLALLKAVCIADGYGPAYVSGISYKIRLGKDNSEVKSVQAFLPNGKKIDRKASYTVAVSSYVASVALFDSADEGRNTFATDTEMIMRYLENQKQVDYRGSKRVGIMKE